MKINKEYAPVALRISMSLVFLWFGLVQIFDKESLISYLPQFAYSLPIDPLTLIFFNGIFETIFGGLLLLGLFTRVSSFLLSLHLLGIAFSLGYNDIAVRDLGLAVATFVVFLNGSDSFCLQKNSNYLKDYRFYVI